MFSLQRLALQSRTHVGEGYKSFYSLLPRHDNQFRCSRKVSKGSFVFQRNDEIDKAKQAHKLREDAKHEPTIFTKIIQGEIKATIVFEDEEVLAFDDVQPQAPCHVLVIPKKQIPMLSEAKESDKEVHI